MSILKTKLKSSSITFYQRGNAMSDGTPRGATGSDAVSSLPAVQIEHNWGAANKMLTASEKRLAHSLLGLMPETIAKHQSYEWCAKEHKKFVALRENFDANVEASIVSRETIIKMIGVLAETFQVAVPPAEGLKLYALALDGLPRPVFDAAWQSVLRSHTYKTLPLPGEFIEATEDAKREMNSARLTITNGIRKLELAMQMNGEKEWLCREMKS